MASASSLSVSMECVNICRLRIGGEVTGCGVKNDCNSLSCAWKAPRALSGFLASTPHCLPRGRNGKRRRGFHFRYAFTGAWAAACHTKGPTKVVIPPGNYKAGEIFFAGPCLGPVTVEVHGSVSASKDISDYANGAWIIVERVDGFKIDGVNFAGSFHGTGQSAWKYDTCTKIPVESCGYPPLPPNFIFNDVKNGDIGYLSSIDSKGYHFKIIGSSKVHLHNLKIESPASSPHTNAASVVSSDNIAVTDSTINTGGGHDCVLWGADNKNTVYTHNSCNGRAEH